MIKTFFLLIFFIAIGLLATIGYYEFKNNSNIQNATRTHTSFSLQTPPKDSLKGFITSVSGSVSYQGRGYDYASGITKPQPIVQGDEISTLGDGKAEISFDEVGSISMSPKTHLNVVQTLPQNFVVEETDGEATFQRSGNIPFSIRSLDLGINLDKETNILVNVDTNNSEISFTINTGKVTFYYTDTSNNTSVIPAKSGKQIIFNNNTKTFTVKLL